MKSDFYTSSELRQLLRDRQGGLSQKQFAAELGLSEQMLSNIYKAERSVGNDLVLAYLAPRGRKFIHADVWFLMDD